MASRTRSRDERLFTEMAALADEPSRRKLLSRELWPNAPASAAEMCEPLAYQ